jgi:hypothetical protein
LQDDTVQVGVPGESKHRAGCSQRRWGAAPGFPESLGVTTRQVARLLVVCGVGNGECRGQVIQERKPRPMLAVCQLTDVRGACEAGRGSGWSALCWKCEDERGDGSGRLRMLMRGRCSRRSCLVAGALLTAIRRVPSHIHARGLSKLWLPESCRCWVPNAGWTQLEWQPLG